MNRAFFVLAAGLTVIASGCSSGQADIEPAYAAPATIDGGPAPDDPSAAIAFVGGIYQAYLRGQRRDPGRYYSTGLKARVGRPGGAFSYDPFCLCRKADEFGYSVQRDDPLPDGRRRVEVQIDLGDERHIRAIVLVREDGGWRVDDFGEREGAIHR